LIQRRNHHNSAFLQAEIDLLNDIVVEGVSMIDVG
jgi:hypothetical protein